MGTDLWQFARQLTSWVMPPRTSDPQYATVYYFGVTHAEDICGPASQVAEYGLPFTRYASAPPTNGDSSRQLYLSSQAFKDFSVPGSWDGKGSISGATFNPPAPTIISSTWAAYEVEVMPSGGYNPRESAKKTQYDQDTGCGTACFTASNSYHFDDFGRFRQVSSASNFPGDDKTRTEWTGSQSPALSGINWIAGIWDKRCLTRDSAARLAIDTVATAPCSGLKVSGERLLTTHAAFEPNSGLLTARRTLTTDGDALSASDLLATYDYDPVGHVLHEKYFGGDSQQLGVNSDFEAPATPTYQIDYTATYSAAGALTARRGAYAVANVSVLNETYDPGTGLVATSTDPAGVTTTYTYDARNRLTQTSTPGSVPTGYAYTDASFSTVLTPASVKVSRQSKSDPAATGLVQQQYDYDPFGRLWHEQRAMPSGTAVRETRYSATGLKLGVSEFEATPTHFSVFSGFDAFDRPASVTAPDGKLTTFTWTGVRQRAITKSIATSTTAETQRTTTEHYDSLGRLYKISEKSDDTHTIDTTYGYDTAGHLGHVTMTGATKSTDGTTIQSSTQIRAFNYDARGFLQSEVHPENGTTSYGGYDARGHVGSKTVPDPNSRCNSQSYECFDLQYGYDQAERLITIRSRNPIDPAGPFRLLKEFTYAGGRLQSATRHNYQPAVGDITVGETYAYDPGGRISKKTTHIGPVSSIDKTLEQSYAYNDLGLSSAITYPTCFDAAGCGQTSWGSVALQYKQGYLSAVPLTFDPATSVTTPAFASSISYWPNGMVSEIKHSNGVTDTYDIYTNAVTNGMARPTSITFSNWTSCAPPGISSQPAGGTISYGDPITLSVIASGDTPTYQWYAGQTPMSGETSASLTVSPTQTTSYFVRILNGCGRIDSNTATVTVQLRAPSSLLATRSGPNAITVSWQPSGGAGSYQVWRRSGPSWNLAASTTATSYLDSVASNATYVYQVTAAGSNLSPSAPSNNDLASTLSFTSVSVGMVVSYAQFGELLSGVNAVRAAWGDPPLGWADVLNPALTGCAYGTVSTLPGPGAVIYAAHLMRVRCAMDNALARAGMGPWPYTDPDVTGLPIRAVHLIELEQRTE